MMEVVPYGRQMVSSKIETGTETETKPMEKSRRFMSEPVVDSATTITTTVNNKNSEKAVRYRECMRNHAASIGGHANDGCGEFMPGGELLKCAACGCHRNFHRKEVLGGCADHHLLLHPHAAAPPPPQGMVLYNAVGPTQRWEKAKIGGGGGGGFPSLSSLSLPQPPPPQTPHLYHRNSNSTGGMFGAVDLRNQNESKEDRRSETPEERGGEVGGARSKRFRTKFTQEQKDKMLEFAERVGWRIQRHDDVALSQFCLEVGVKRHVLKVWMHNNKNTLRRREMVAGGGEAALPDASEAEAEAEAPPSSPPIGV